MNKCTKPFLLQIQNRLSTTLGTFEHQLLCIYILRETYHVLFVPSVWQGGGYAERENNVHIKFRNFMKGQVLCLSITYVIYLPSNLPQHNLNDIWNNAIQSEFLFFKPNNEALLLIWLLVFLAVEYYGVLVCCDLDLGIWTFSFLPVSEHIPQWFAQDFQKCHQLSRSHCDWRKEVIHSVQFYCNRKIFAICAPPYI